MAQRDKIGDVMTDADFEKALDELREQDESGEVGELLKMMNENRMISWEEAEQILGGSNYNEPVKSSLPAQTRPSEPDNDTDVDMSIQRLIEDDPKLKEINLNNMKRTPIPQVKRLVEAIRDNTHLEKLSLANMGLYDGNLEPLVEVIENNVTLKSLNLETNYLSGDFFTKLFRAALKNQTLEEVKAVNQGITFATVAEKDIIDAIFENKGLIKVSINLRLPEGRHKIENAMLRNGEIRRILRRQQAAAKAQEEAAQKRAEKAEVKPNGVNATPAPKPKSTKLDKEDAKPKPKTEKNDEKVVEGPSAEKAEKKIVKKAKKTVPKKDADTGEKRAEVVKKEASTAKDTTAAAESAAKTSTSAAKPKASATAKKAAAASGTTEKVAAKAEPKAATEDAEGKPKEPAGKVAPKTVPKTAPKTGTGKKIDEPMAVYPRKKQL